VETGINVPPTNRLPSQPDSPAPGQPSGQDASVLWLVSFGDEDDRELLPSQIATALRQGQIDGATIVWRDGLPDWLPISSVPALAALIPTSGETTTAPMVIANLAPEAKAAPTEDVTTAPGLGNNAATEAGARAGVPAETQPVAKIALKTSPQPRGAVAEEIASVKAGDAPTDTSDKPAWRGKTKIGLPKVDVQRPEIARRLEPVKAPAAKVEATAKPSATATPRPGATAAATPPGAATAKPPVAAGVKPPEPAAVPRVEAPPANPPEDVEPETSRPVPAAMQPAKVEPPPAPVPEHSPDAPTAKLPEVAKTDARKPPVPDRRPPPARSTMVGVGGTPGNVGAAKPAPKPPTRAPQVAAPKAETGSRGARDIWNDTDEEEEPISLDPSSIRPPTPSPSPNIAKATALSSGTLGLSRKPAPKPPTPKALPRPPEAPVEMTPGTPSLQALSAPFSTRTEGERVDDLLHLEAAPAKVGILAPPTFEPPSGHNLDEIGSDLIVETEDEQPTIALGFDALDALTKAPAPSAPENAAPENAAPAAARAKAMAPAAAAAPRAPEKKRSLVPFYVGGAIVALGISIGVRQMGGSKAPAEPAPENQRQPPSAPIVEPRPAEPSQATAPIEPESPAAPEPKPAAEPHKPTTSVVGNEPAPKPAPVAKAEPGPKAEPAPKKPVAAEPAKAVDMGGEFDRAAAAAALGAAATSAAGCRKDGDPTGLAVVKVTFTNSGKATRAVIEGPPFAGTATGGCIAAQMRAAKVPPFGGDRVTVSKRVVIQ
jgi:hypothetical protein